MNSAAKNSTTSDNFTEMEFTLWCVKRFGK